VSITPLYAAVLGFVLVALSLRVILVRRSLRVGLGDANHPELLRAIRVHGNFVEYVPTALLLVLFVELGGGGAWLCHALCWALVTGRLLHAFGVSRVQENLVFRQVGMLLTFSTLLVASLAIVWLGVSKN